MKFNILYTGTWGAIMAIFPFQAGKKIRYLYAYITKNDTQFLLTKITNRLKYFFCNKRLYQLWIDKYEPSKSEVNQQINTRLQYEPTISMVIRLDNIPNEAFPELLRSIVNQSYPHWELCIAYINSTDQKINNIIGSYEEGESRIKILHLNENDRGTAHSREVLSLITGGYISFLEQDCTLAPFALFEVARAINNNPGVDVLYSDEDTLSEDGTRRYQPQFKPDWSPDTLRSCNYIHHLLVLSKELLTQIDCIMEQREGDISYDLSFRATEKARSIVHIPQVLYHSRSSRTSAVFAENNPKGTIADRGQTIVADHLYRTGMKGTVQQGLLEGSYTINYQREGDPLISIIIPSNNHTDDLEKCVRSILDKSSYKQYEIIIADNNSTDDAVAALYDRYSKDERIKLIRWDKPFNFSAINNFAVRSAAGSILLFLNNDTEVINPNWLQEMLAFAVRNDVGAVGAKLYYPDGTIQHAGIILGIRGVTGHAHRHYPHDSPGYMGRLKIVQNVSAVTGACLMTRKDIFEEINGFDESYPVAFSDLDLCLKYLAKGYLNVWTPYAEMYHDESKTRGYEDISKSTRFRDEFEIFKKKWPQYLTRGDVYYNINLTLEREDFLIKL